MKTEYQAEHFLHAELVVGWESVTYTVFEDEQSSEQICMLVQSENVLGAPARLAIIDMPNAAQGEIMMY